MIDFFVPGLPAPGGSKRSFVHRVTGRVVTMDDCPRNKDWRAVVALAARQAYRGDPLDVPLAVEMTFTLPRPRGHYGTGRNAARVKPSAPSAPAVRPDVLKLARSTEDALTGVIWKDDAATVALTVRKVYGERPGARIRVEPAGEAAPCA